MVQGDKPFDSTNYEEATYGLLSRGQTLKGARLAGSAEALEYLLWKASSVRA